MGIPVATAPYAEQVKNWPQTGKHILAQFDDETIIVYQAYCPEIGQFAIEKGFFGGDFKYSRMSWIKPNFLWMMYRSSWGQAEGQQVVLALRLKRAFFNSLLAQAVPSSFGASNFSSRDEWTAAVAKSDVRLQWDPDHTPTGEKTERRAIQLGLRGVVLESYGKREILQVIDMTGFVAEQRANIHAWEGGKLLTPVENVYVAGGRQVGDQNTIPDRCTSCGLVLLYGAIFDAAAERERLGPILGIHKDADPETAKAGYIGISSLWLYDQAPDLYRCPRCKTIP